MKKNLFILAFLLGSFSLPTWAQKQEKTLTVEVHNNWNQAKTDAPVVINLHDLHTGFKIKSAVVMEGANEVPSQLDDLNRDRKMDELAFVTDLPAHGRKTFQITLSSEKSTKTYPVPSVCFMLMMRSFQTVSSFVVNLLYDKFRQL